MKDFLENVLWGVPSVKRLLINQAGRQTNQTIYRVRARLSAERIIM